MYWTKQSDQEPTEKDLPFITYQRKVFIHDRDVFYNEYELWNDTDWFFELEEKDRLEWVYWMPLTKHKKKKS